MKISVVKGEHRKENIKRAVQLIERDIDKAIKVKNSNQLFIKVNAIDSNFPIACTHVDVLYSVLEIFYNRFDEIIMGDNTFVFTKDRGGPYRKILDKFPRVKFSDLTEYESEDIEFKILNNKTINGKISLLPRKAFTISLALPKTHDAFVYTGCLKNMFGCVTKNRGYMHAMNIYEKLFFDKYVKSNKFKWNNLINVIKNAKADLHILDAYEGMEGNGPMFGTKVKLGIAMCSLDGVALDKLASKICGFDYVPYLSMLPHNSNNIEVIKDGFEDIGEITKKFKLHYKHKYQIMEDTNIFPWIDIKFVMELLKRSYRIKDKIIEKLWKEERNRIN